MSNRSKNGSLSASNDKVEVGTRKYKWSTFTLELFKSTFTLGWVRFYCTLSSWSKHQLGIRSHVCTFLDNSIVFSWMLFNVGPCSHVLEKILRFWKNLTQSVRFFWKRKIFQKSSTSPPAIREPGRIWLGWSRKPISLATQHGLLPRDLTLSRRDDFSKKILRIWKNLTPGRKIFWEA